tara:strand:+ start:108 stop:308 length:201 start_codon:yes stop_codon:yes gene_type:complete
MSFGGFLLSPRKTKKKAVNIAGFMSHENTETNQNMGIGFSLYVKVVLLNLDYKPDSKNAKSDYIKE